MEKNKYPIIAGLFLFISGVIGIIVGLIYAFFQTGELEGFYDSPHLVSILFVGLFFAFIILILFLSVLLIIGSICCFKKRYYIFILIVSILGIIFLFFTFYIPILSIVSLVFLIKSKNEFK